MSRSASAGLLVVPPVGDPTVTFDAPEGWTVLDLGRELTRRLTAPDGVDERAAAAEEAARRGEAGAAGAALRLRAAAAVLRRAADPLARLHAAALAHQVGGADHSVSVRLDDLEVPGGSTESLGCVAALDAGRFPFAPELDRAGPALRAARGVACVLDCDQRLPAAVAIAREVDGPLTLLGPYAATHAAALSRLDAFSEAVFDPELPPRRAAGLPGDGAAAEDTGVSWFPDQARSGPGGEQPAPAGEPFAGAVHAHAVSSGPPGPGRRAAVVRVCALVPGVVAADGRAGDRERFTEGARRWRDAGAPIVLELLAGAPGVGREELTASVAELCAPGAAWSVLGVRRFHLAIDVPAGAWRSLPLTLAPVGGDRDLARSREFSAPGSLDAGELPALIEALTATARKAARLAPARVAGAVLALAGAGAEPSQPAMRPDVAVVDSPTGLDGAGPRSYAVSLERGTTFALQPPLPGLLRALADRGEAALAPLASEARRTLLDRLRRGGFVHGGT